MKTTLTAALIATLAAPVMAGGPVIIEEMEAVAERPASSVGILPILIAVAIGVALMSSDDDNNNSSSG